MDNLISKQAALNCFSDWIDSRGDVHWADEMSEYRKIESLLPVDAVPVRHGRWIKHDTGHSIYYSCSLCDCIAHCIETADKILWKMTNFCPNCGADMRKYKDATN